MATEKQIAANRQNAKKSTGPRTEEGKAASSRNATSHGLFSALLLRSFAPPLLRSSAPPGGPKDQPPRASLSRLMGIAYCQIDEKLGRLSRYESHLRRALRQCLHDLESMQQRRRELEKEKEKTNPIPPQPIKYARPSGIPDNEWLPTWEPNDGPDEEFASPQLSPPAQPHPSAGTTGPDMRNQG